jgi:ABC-type branched-subunit amino acid transport system ATPase component
VRLGGEDVTGLAPHLLARRGLSRTFQNLQLFLRTTVLENVMVGRHRHESTKATPFMFFILNASTQFVSVILPNKVAFLTGSDGQLRNVDLIQSANAMMVFPPNPLLGGK